MELVLVLIFLALAASVDYCSIPGCGTNHMYCINSSFNMYPHRPNIETDKFLTFGEKLDVLRLHNEFRNKVALGLETRGKPGPQPKASAMMELVWDYELEHMALTYGSVNGDNAETCFYKLDGTRVGRYASKVIGNQPESYVKVIQDKIQNLTREGFRASGITDSEKKAAKLLTDHSTKLGCARVVYTLPDKGHWDLLWCFYAPARIQGLPIYITGEPCSRCPTGTHCSKTNKGLCHNPFIVDPLKLPERTETCPVHPPCLSCPTCPTCPTCSTCSTCSTCPTCLTCRVVPPTPPSHGCGGDEDPPYIP